MIIPDDRPTASEPAVPAFAYPGRELESMTFAVKYHRWILDRFRPYLGKRIVEVGAGTGAFTDLLLETQPEALLALEPSTNLFPKLAAFLAARDPHRTATPMRSTLAERVVPLREAKLDSAVYVNVLEHIEDDRFELETAHSLLGPGGRLLVFVPANPWLMGSMDRQFGHHRRYTLGGLSRLCRNTGFDVLSATHFDMLGIVPWWLLYRVWQSERMDPGAVRLYDRLAVPICRIVEDIVPPPVGKNILLIARKSERT